ncbi:MAG: hypothetical protein MH472_03740 [Bacteroidia bacterium]|nr:hypothetical protein [Bacteroidia bacterium]
MLLAEKGIQKSLLNAINQNKPLFQTNKKPNEMKELSIENKQEYLNEHYPFSEIPNLSDKNRCIHCYEIITVGDFKVFKGDSGFEFICCPNAPECDGTVIDWQPIK